MLLCWTSSEHYPSSATWLPEQVALAILINNLYNCVTMTQSLCKFLVATEIVYNQLRRLHHLQEPLPNVTLVSSIFCCSNSSVPVNEIRISLRSTSVTQHQMDNTDNAKFERIWTWQPACLSAHPGNVTGAIAVYECRLVELHPPPVSDWCTRKFKESWSALES